jgi:DNA-binding NarL/FixJ family response regulator
MTAAANMATLPRLRVLIVDDSETFIHAARALLGREGFAVVGVASNSAEGLRLEAELKPDLTLVDIDLGAESGFELARRLAGTRAQHASRVILISTHAEGDFSELIQSSPVEGFLGKSELSAEGIYKLLRLG